MRLQAIMMAVALMLGSAPLTAKIRDASNKNISSQNDRRERMRAKREKANAKKREAAAKQEAEEERLAAEEQSMLSRKQAEDQRLLLLDALQHYKEDPSAMTALDKRRVRQLAQALKDVEEALAQDS